MDGAVILLAGGSGTRMGAGVKKELIPVQGKPGILRCAEAFSRFPEITTMVIVHPSGGDEPFRTLPYPFSGKILYVEGGTTRQRSVLAALEALDSSPPDFVLIHDGARPFVSDNEILSVIDGVARFGACLPVVPAVNALKEADSEGWIVRHVNRAEFSAALTPQGFFFGPLLGAHRQAIRFSDAFTDDSEIWDRYIGKVWSVPGDPANIKITYPADLAESS